MCPRAVADQIRAAAMLYSILEMIGKCPAAILYERRLLPILVEKMSDSGRIRAAAYTSDPLKATVQEMVADGRKRRMDEDVRHSLIYSSVKDGSSKNAHWAFRTHFGKNKLGLDLSKMLL